MSTGHTTMRNKQAIKQWLRHRHAGCAEDAAASLHLAPQEVRRELDALVASGIAECLRPVACDHTEFDYYRMTSRPQSRLILSNPQA